MEKIDRASVLNRIQERGAAYVSIVAIEEYIIINNTRLNQLLAFHEELRQKPRDQLRKLSCGVARKRGARSLSVRICDLPAVVLAEVRALSSTSSVVPKTVAVCCTFTRV